MLARKHNEFVAKSHHDGEKQDLYKRAQNGVERCGNEKTDDDAELMRQIAAYSNLAQQSNGQEYALYLARLQGLL